MELKASEDRPARAGPTRDAPPEPASRPAPRDLREWLDRVEAMATRCIPSEDIDILRQTGSTWLDPAQNPPEERPWGSKALINACMEHRYRDVVSARSVLSRSVYERVRARWAEPGLPDAAPEVRALEEDPPAD